MPTRRALCLATPSQLKARESLEFDKLVEMRKNVEHAEANNNKLRVKLVSIQQQLDALCNAQIVRSQLKLACKVHIMGVTV